MGPDFVKLFTKTHGFTNEIDIFVLMKKFTLLLFSLLFMTVFSQSKLTVCKQEVNPQFSMQLFIVEKMLWGKPTVKVF